MTMPTQLDLLKLDWCELCEPVVLAGHFITFTSDDLHPILPTPQHCNWFGVLMARMKNKGLVERIGYQPSRRPEANGRPIAIWRKK
jgi:hypothetical protein